MKPKKNCLIVRQRNSRFFLEIAEIVYIEADGYNRVAVHTAEKKQVYQMRGTLKMLMRKTTVHSFLRIHNGVLANMTLVKGFTSETNFQAAGGKLLMKTDEKLPVSRSRHKAVLDYFDRRGL